MDLSPPKIMTDKQRRNIVIGVLVAMMLAALDQTIVAPALPTTIGASLRRRRLHGVDSFRPIC